RPRRLSTTRKDFIMNTQSHLGSLVHKLAGRLLITSTVLAGCAGDPGEPSGNAVSDDGDSEVDPTTGDPTTGDTAPDVASDVTPDAAAAIQHVFVIAMENHAASQIYGNAAHAPFINNTLLPQGGRASNFVDELPAAP